MASQDISIVLDDDSIEIDQNKTQDLEFLIKNVWDDDLGIGQNILANFIEKIKSDSNLLPEKILEEILSQKDVLTKGKTGISILEQLILLQETNLLFDERLAIRVLNEFSPETNEKLRIFYDGLWNRLTKEKSSETLLLKLIELDFDYVRKKLDHIAKEADKDGWGLIKYIEGYDEIFLLCMNDSSGSLFQAILRYFIEKVKSNEFIDKVGQTLAKTLIEDIRYRLNFSDLFPQKLHIYIKILEKLDSKDQKAVEMILRSIFLSNEDDFYMITIGFSEYTHLIKTISNKN